jgi:hydrogenase maturation protease HycI
VDVSEFLKDWLHGAERLAIVGVGSTLRGDDAAGMRVVERLAEEYPEEFNPHLMFCPGETAPENFSGKIRAFNPTHLLLIDAADIGITPGEIVEIPADKVGGPGFLSHMLPLKVLVSFLAGDSGMKSMLLGVQYRSLEFDAPLTPEIAAAVDTLCDALRCAIGECLKP